MPISNPLTQFNPGEDITDIFESITVEEGIAKESKRPYRFIKLTMCNGEDLRLFVPAMNYYPLKDAIEKARK